MHDDDDYLAVAASLKQLKLDRSDRASEGREKKKEGSAQI